jgi:hemin uptake protein HemP
MPNPLPSRAPARPAPATTLPPRTTSRDLLGPRGELVIAHDGREYRLRITQNNRLILTA